MKRKTAILFLIINVICYTLYVSQVQAQSSNTYKLRDYGFGSGGGAPLTGTQYSLEGVLGEQGGSQTGNLYNANSGLTFTRQSNVPAAPTFVNSSNWPNKLKITINKWSGDPSDTTYAIAISDDNWVTTKWVQTDSTVGASLGLEDFQSYSTWGGASGSFIIGLATNTTYKVKVAAREGGYAQSPLGPEASAATSGLLLSFDIDIGSSSDPGETAAPYSVSVGSLSAGSVATASNRVWFDFTTNGPSGGYVYIYSQNGGLKSTILNYTISSASTNLAAASEGFGVQGSSKAQTSGGPLEYVSPYDGSSDTVGVVNSTIRQIFTSSAAPIADGRGSFLIKAKVSGNTPAASDYAETITLIASGSY